MWFYPRRNLAAAKNLRPRPEPSLNLKLKPESGSGIRDQGSFRD